MLKSRLLVVSILLSIIASFCLTGSNAMAAPKDYYVYKAASGTQLLVFTGDTLKVVLDQNTPSTGFAWELVENSDPTVLQCDGNVIMNSPQIGGTGTDTWIFSALQAGTSTIRLEYSQPWPGGEKNADSFVLTVEVHNSPSPVPALSGFFTILMIAGFVALMVPVIIWRKHCQQAGI